MKKFTYLAIFAGLFFQACSTTSQLKYAEQLYKEKQFAESVNVLRSIKEPDAKAYLLLANAEFQLAHMQRAAQAYEHVPAEFLSDDDKAHVAVALHQGKMVITDTALTQLQLGITPTFANEFADEAYPFYCNGVLHFSTTNDGQFSNSAVSPVTGKTYTDLVSFNRKNTLISKLNTAGNDGPVAIGKHAVVFNRSIPASKRLNERLALYEIPSLDFKRRNIEIVNFCTDSFNYMHPYFQNEKTLIFSTNFIELSGKKNDNYDLYFSTKNFTDAFADWLTPKPLSNEINSTYNEVFPTFLNENTLVFSSDRPGGYGGLDLYISHSDSLGNWGSPTLLPAPINSVRDDFHLINVLNDVTHYYVGSNRNGSDDIFEFEVFIPIQWKTFWESEILLVPAMN
ncbi:MAG: hypothetical protein NWQ44_02690 [Flavobacteriales bacterium]|jgi:hypothetical protein|nr:hypothetical protein [Flavobacteriales bacterium]MDP4732202.1 hypothetical protein [Flavobacteriales bacterium]MDP4817638.1 hypothetical protein [Flavobacteriales bacterium]MDP4950615.1 hypothetical protein [Flavobacteriales bacterium]